MIGKTNATVIVGGGTNKLPQVVDKTITTITAEDLQGATKIGKNAFEDCTQLTSVVIPSGVTFIDMYGFAGCSNLSSVILPDTLTRMSSFSFYYNSVLKNIEIPSSFTTFLGGFHFQSLETMTIKATTPPTMSQSNVINSTIQTIYIPSGTLSAYESATNWAAFTGKFVEMAS